MTISSLRPSRLCCLRCLALTRGPAVPDKIRPDLYDVQIVDRAVDVTLLQNYLILKTIASEETKQSTTDAYPFAPASAMSSPSLELCGLSCLLSHSPTPVLH